jgi:HPt (histidine-containing phosphotransfer) domain-containing protein
MDDYLTKPLRTDALRAALTRWLRPPRESAGTPVIAPAPGGPAAASTPPAVPDDPIDRQALAAIYSAGVGGMGTLSRVVGLFLRDTPGLLRHLRQALERGDTAVAWTTAHNLKSSSAFVGATRMSQLCAELETLGRRNDLAPAVERFKEIEAEYRRLEPALDSLRQEKAS